MPQSCPVVTKVQLRGNRGTEVQVTNPCVSHGCSAGPMLSSNAVTRGSKSRTKQPWNWSAGLKNVANRSGPKPGAFSRPSWGRFGPEKTPKPQCLDLKKPKRPFDCTGVDGTDALHKAERGPKSTISGPVGEPRSDPKIWPLLFVTHNDSGP